MSSVIIEALEDSLSKPDLDPVARERLMGRLDHHQSGHGVHNERKPHGNRRAHRGGGTEAQQCYAEILPIAIQLREQDDLSYQAIEDRLRLAGFTNSRGHYHHNVTIRRLIVEARPDLIKQGGAQNASMP